MFAKIIIETKSGLLFVRHSVFQLQLLLLQLLTHPRRYEMSINDYVNVLNSAGEWWNDRPAQSLINHLPQVATPHTPQIMVSTSNRLICQRKINANKSNAAIVDAL